MDVIYHHIRSPLFPLLAALVVITLWVGCDSGGSPPETEPIEPSKEDGTVSFTLARTADSAVPASADSALIRIWQPDGTFNLRRIVTIPDPGQQTEVSLSVPASTGYRAGVIAVESGAFPGLLLDKTIRAHAASNPFTVQVNDTSQVVLNVRPADLTVELPSELAPGVTDTLRATFHLNAPGITHTLVGIQGPNPQFGIFSGTQLDRLSRTPNDSTVRSEFSITGPDINSEDTTYVKVWVSHSGTEESWLPPGRRIQRSYFPSFEGPSFEIPVVPSESGNGTVIITFSSDGTAKKRRVVR